ncbi:MAG: hypothetical protein R3F46_13375 [bacterium]
MSRLLKSRDMSWRYQLMILSSMLCMSCNQGSDTNAVSVDVANFPPQQRWVVSAYRTWPGYTFAGLAWQLQQDGTFRDGTGILLQFYMIVRSESGYQIQFISERDQVDLERTILLLDDNTSISLAGRYGEDKDPYLMKNGLLTDEYVLPENFRDVIVQDLTGGTQISAGQSVYLGEEGEFVVLKTLDRVVQQFWIGKQDLQEINLPAGRLRSCDLQDDLSEYPGLLDENGRLYTYSSDSNSFILVADMEWLSTGLEADDLPRAKGRLDLAVSRNLAAIKDDQGERIRVYLRTGEVASLRRLEPLEENPNGGPRRAAEANRQLDLPLVILEERNEIADDQFTRSASLVPLDDDSIAIIDVMYQRVLVVSPKNEETE